MPGRLIPVSYSLASIFFGIGSGNQLYMDSPKVQIPKRQINF